MLVAVKKSLTFDLYGKDKTASKTIRGVGDEADSLGKRMGKVGAGIAAGLAVAGAAAVAFGIDSVKAFAEAQESQNRLQFALEKFPKAADTNIRKLGELNTALMKKTRFDDDAIAAAQGTLLQYELTGKQLEELTPLLLDFAAKTGQDLPTAAEALGKALMGQGRALKDVGIDFVDTGTAAGNFDQLVAGLRQQVGGFAEQDAETAGGKLEMLKNRFGEVQEQIGEALMPQLERLLDWLEGDGAAALDDLTAWIVNEAIPNLSGFVDWVIKWKDELGLVAGAIGTATAAQWLLNGAMAANPIGIVVAALIAASAWIIHVMNNFEDMRTMMLDAAESVARGIVGMVRGQAQIIENFVNGMVDGINLIIKGINNVLSAVGAGKIGLVAYWKMNTSGLDQVARNVQVSGGGGGRRATYMAEGGIVRPTAGGTSAVIGEAGTAEAVIPLSPGALAKYGLGGGGDTYVTVNVQGAMLSDERKIVTAVRDAFKNQRGQGFSTQGAFA